MKNILLIIIILSVGCNQQNQQVESTSLRSSDSLDVTQNKDISIAALNDPHPLKLLPASFLLDSTFHVDTIFNYTVKLYFQKSNSNTEFNKILKQFLEVEAGKSKPEEKANKKKEWSDNDCATFDCG